MSCLRPRCLLRCTTMSKQVALSLVLVVLQTGGTCAQEVQRDDATKREELAKGADQAAQSQKAAAAEVQRFAFGFADDREVKLKLHETPILRYTNPLRGEVHSALFVWTHEGRPEVVASISNWYTPRPYRGLAATSLSQGKLVGMRDGEEIWLPR